MTGVRFCRGGCCSCPRDGSLAEDRGRVKGGAGTSDTEPLSSLWFSVLFFLILFKKVILYLLKVSVPIV